MKKCDMLIGTQYGSESKGMVSAELAIRHEYDLAISVNSCQAGHTSYYQKDDGSYLKIVNRQLPSAFPYVKKIVIAAGAMIKPHVLKEEIEFLEKNGFKIREKLFIDNQAGVVPDDAGEQEKELVKNIGSTGEGVGWAMSQRIMRCAPLARDMREFKDYGELCDVWKLYSGYDTALIEGSQGFGLSLFHSFYPKCTSRDAGTAAFLSGAGMSHKYLDKVYGVARTFPIRVGTVVHSSGPMHMEIDWDMVTKESGSKTPIIERTTVTKRVRRVGRWDGELVKKAVDMNGVDSLVLTFINYINAKDAEVDSYNALSEEARAFIERVNSEICRVSFISTSPYSMFEVNL